MQWVTGFAPSIPNTQPQFTPRQSAGLHPQQTGTLWNCGFRMSDVRSFAGENGVVTFVGQCFATDAELRRQLERDVSWREFMQWPGAYTVIVESDASTVVLAPVSGVRQMYYAAAPDGCWWSTAAMPLAALIGAELDYAAVALDLSTKGLDPAMKETTFFKGVRRVPPGGALVVRQGVCSIQRWHKLRYHDDFDAAAADLQRALSSSIDRMCSLGGRLVADLSGGKDSSTLASLAKARKEDLVGITFVTPNMINDDLRYAKIVAARMGIEHRVVEGGEATLHYAGLDQVPLTDLPSNDAVLGGYNRAKWQAVSDITPDLYMTGTAGDCLLDAISTQLCDLYKKDWMAGVRGARGHARRLTAPFLGMALAVRRMSRTPYPRSLLNLAKTLRDGEEFVPDKLQGMAWCGQTFAANWMTPGARVHVAELVEELAEGAPEPALISNFQDLHDVQAIGGAREVCHALAAEAGAAYYQPFFDTGVVDACLSLEGPVRVGRPGFKPILGAAFGNALPAELVKRRTKGNFNGMMYEGLRRNAATLTRLVETSVLVQRSLLSGDQVAASLRRAINGLPAPLGDIQRFVVLELWMQRLRLARTDWWEENAR